MGEVQRCVIIIIIIIIITIIVIIIIIIMVFNQPKVKVHICGYININEQKVTIIHKYTSIS